MRRGFNVQNTLYFIALSIASGIILASVKHSKKLTPEQKASLKEIKRLEKDAKKLCDEIKKHKNDKKWMEEHNDELQKRYDELYDAYQKAYENGSIRIINMVSKAYETKESTDIVNTKLAIYESCDAGYITEDEKFELLNMIESEVISEKVDPETKSAATWMLGSGAASALAAWLTMNNIFTIADLNDAIKTTTKDIKEEKERSKPNTTKIKELEERLKKLKFARNKKAILTALTGGSTVFTGAIAKASYDNL